MNALKKGAPLSGREREVLALVADGLANDEIAERLFLSPHTIRGHVRTAFAKLGARNRPNAVFLAVRAGEISLPLPEIQP